MTSVFLCVQIFEVISHHQYLCMLLAGEIEARTGSEISRSGSCER